MDGRPPEFKALLENAGPGATQGAAVYPQNYQARPYVIAQADYKGGATGNVVLKGRINSSYAWVTLYTFTASASKEVSWFPEMKADADTIAGGTVDAGLMG